ncbi:MAG: hypothetical protein AB7O98_00460 [Hyphomonadaceae bacterium]
MGAVGRIIGIVLIVVLIAVGAAYFLVGSKARGGGEFTVDRAPQTVVTWLASAPAGAPVAEGVTVTEVVSHDDNVVVANVAFADGATGQVTYTVTPDPAEPNRAHVALQLERDLGFNPLNRVQAVTGGDAPQLATAAVETASASLSALQADVTPIAYTVEQLAPQPFLYVQNCSPTDDVSITSVLRQALNGARSVMGDLGLAQAGPPIAVEPSVAENEYCYQIGYPYSGATPGPQAFTRVGQTPSGVALKVEYTGTEADVVPQVYDRLDALLAAARLDDPSITSDDWPTMEVYHDDPTQAGGSRNRTIYYVVPSTVDVTRLTAIAPPTAAPAAPAAAEAPAAEAAPEAPATTTEAPTPATTP